MGEIIFLIIVGVIVFFVVKSKKKKKQEQKKIDDSLEKIYVFSEEIVNCTEVEFPDFYFERIFLKWYPNSEENIEKAINDLDYMFNFDFTSFANSLNTLQENCMQYSLFLKNEDEYNNYYSEKSEEDVNTEICLTLPLYASLRGFWKECLGVATAFQLAWSDFHEKNMSGVIGDREPENVERAMKLAKETFIFAIELKWKKIVNENPQWNTDLDHQLFLDLATTEEHLKDFKEIWIPFYIDKYVEFYKKIGVLNYQENIGKVLQSINKNTIIAIRDGVTRYSSIYEIDDYSEDNINRIVELYKSGKISGAYSKSKDPKYCS